MKKQVSFQKLLNIIELAPPVLDKRNFKIASKQFEEWKLMVKKQRKILAKKYHPDKGGSLEKMQEINDAIDLLLTIRIEPPKPIMRRVVVVRTSTSATTTGGFSWTSGTYW